METEGHIVNKPPMFKCKNYDYWKQRMMTFFYACHNDMWDVVENVIRIWSRDSKVFMERRTEEKTRNFLMCALTKLEYEKVHNCKSSKEMLGTLVLAYEGTS
ncbi:hypothetical protein CR513_11672, partial [Mucuna pruriens]